MSRIGRKPVAVPANVKVSVADSTIQVEGPKGKLAFTHRPEIGVRYDEAGKQVLVTRRDDERHSRALHGLTRSLIANMVQGVTDGYTKKLEIVGVGYQAQLKKANTVALQVGYANQVVLEAPPGVSVDGPRPDPRHDHRGRQAGGRPVRRRWSARSAPPSPTRARASATRARSSAARPARRSARSKPICSRDAAGPDRVGQLAGWASGRHRPPLNPEDRAEDRPVNQHKLVQVRRLRRQRHVRKRLSGTPERPRLAVFRSSKHIYAQVINDADRHDPGLGQHARPRDQGPARPTAATRRPPRSSAGSSPSGPSRPVLTRFASTAEATSIMAGSRPWPTPPARRGCSSDPDPSPESPAESASIRSD